MNRPWEQFDAELRRRNRSIGWLAKKLGCSIQRVQNWTTRGVPKSAFPELAAAFDETIDWVAGRAPRAFDEDTLAYAILYQRLNAEDRRTYREVLEVVARRPASPGPLRSADQPPAFGNQIESIKAPANDKEVAPSEALTAAVRPHTGPALDRRRGTHGKPPRAGKKR